MIYLRNTIYFSSRSISALCKARSIAVRVGGVKFKKRMEVVCLMAEKHVVTIPAIPVSSYVSEQLPQADHWWGSELGE
jgi:hypothetical protein